MTRAPANLMAVRTLLLTHLDNAPGPDDLEPGEVGIVGDPAHRGGYHCGSDRVVSGDYSVVESPRDRAGLTDYAAALDVGPFSVTVNGKTHNLQTFSAWCVGECAANAPDTRDIREIIYSTDGSTVKRWDRLGKRTSGDSSHRWHTHFSFFRDAIKAGRDQRPLFARYLQRIGLLKVPATVEDDMFSETDRMMLTAVRDAIFVGGTDMGRKVDPDGSGSLPAKNSFVAKTDYLARVLDALAAKDFTNEPEIAATVLKALTPEMFAQAIKLAGVTPEAFAAALPEGFADALMVALGRKLSQ
jgi:hypothetical protein